jgi:hypothetical protein
MTGLILIASTLFYLAVRWALMRRQANARLVPVVRRRPSFETRD